MLFLATFVTMVSVWIIFAVPLGLLGFWISGFPGLLMGLVLGLGLALLWSLRAEKQITKVHFPAMKNPIGLDKTYERVLEDYRRPFKAQYRITVPKIRTYENPYPQVIAMRSPRSAGTIMVSQGLLTRVSENELRLILREAVERCQAREIFLATTLGLFSFNLFRCAPRQWAQTVFSLPRNEEEKSHFSVFNGLVFFAFYPFLRFFLNLGSRFPWKDNDASGLKILNSPMSFRLNPGLSHLYLC